MSSVDDKIDNMKINNEKFTQTFEVDIPTMPGGRRSHNLDVRPQLVSRIASDQSPIHQSPVQPIPGAGIDNELVSLLKITPSAKARIRSFLHSKTLLDQKACHTTHTVPAPNPPMTKNVQESLLNSVFSPEQTLQRVVKEVTENISDSSDSTKAKSQKVVTLAQAPIRPFLCSKTVLDQETYSAISVVKTEPVDIDTNLPLLNDNGKVELFNGDIRIDDRNSGECDANQWNDLMPPVNFASNVKVKTEPPNIDKTSPIFGDIAKEELTKDMKRDETDNSMCVTNQSSDKLWNKKSQSKKGADLVKISKNETKVKIASENAQNSPACSDAKHILCYIIDKQGNKTKRIYIKQKKLNDNDSEIFTTESKTISNQIIEKQNSIRNKTEKLKETPDLSKETFPLNMLSEGASDCNRYVKVTDLKTHQSIAEKEEDFSKHGNDKYISTGNSKSICPTITKCRKPMDTSTPKVPTGMDGTPKTNELLLVPFTERALQSTYESDIELYYDSEGTHAIVDPIPIFLVPNKHYIKAPIKVHLSDNCDSNEGVACVSLVDADFDRLKTNKDNVNVAKEPMNLETMPLIHGEYTVKVGLINDGKMVQETKSIRSATNHENVVLPDQGFAADIEVKTEPQIQRDLVETELEYDNKYLDQCNTLQVNCLPSNHTFSTSSDSCATVPLIKTESLAEDASPQTIYDHVEIELVNDEVMVGAASSDERCDQSFETDSDPKRTVKVKEAESSSISTNQQQLLCVQLDTKPSPVDIKALDVTDSYTNRENDLHLSDQSCDHLNSANCNLNSTVSYRKRKDYSFDVEYLDQCNTLQANCLPSDHTFMTLSDRFATVFMLKTESLKEGITPQTMNDHVEVELVKDEVMVGSASSDDRCKESFETDFDPKHTVKIKEAESSSLSTNQEKLMRVQLDTKPNPVDKNALDGAYSKTHQETVLHLSDQSSDHRNSSNCKMNSSACNRKKKYDSLDSKENKCLDHVEVERVNDEVKVGVATSDARCYQSVETDSDPKRKVRIKEAESSSLSTNQEKLLCVQLDTKPTPVDENALDGANSTDLHLSDRSSDHLNSVYCKVNSDACNRKRKHDSLDGKENSVKKTKSDETLDELKDAIDKRNGICKTNSAHKLNVDVPSKVTEKYDKFHNSVCNSFDHNYASMHKVNDHTYSAPLTLRHDFKRYRCRINLEKILSTIKHDHDYCLKHSCKWSICMKSYLQQSSRSISSLSSSSNFKLSTNTELSLSKTSYLPQPKTLLKSLLPKNLKSLLSKSSK